MKKKYKKIILAVALLAAFMAQAQKETQNWYFATKAGLDFSTSPPTAVTNGSITNAEGSSVMSDIDGNLLFYTDGVTVYNKNHAVMANGTGLLGDYSSTQSALIIKKPASQNSYYIFTTDDGGTGGINGLNYSLVDMSLAAGLGSVTVKNATLYAPGCEKIAAVRHCNGTDIWILSHELSSNTFHANLLSANGVNTLPVLSSVGTVITNNAGIGQMKASPNGRKLGVAIFDGNIPTQPAPPNVGGFEVYDFDPSSGSVSNPVFLFSDWSAYGCEFSPDGTKFYGSLFSGDQLFQWNLCAGTSAAIIASQYSVAPVNSGFNYGSLQLGLDGRIYVALKQKQKLSVINNPDALGSACGYQHLTQNLAQKTTDLNLPYFMSSYFKPLPPPLSFTVSSCQTASFAAGSFTNQTSISCNAANYSITAVQWAFGDPSTGTNNLSMGTTSSHLFSGPGTYTVKCIYIYPCSADTSFMAVTINGSAPSLTTAGTFTICKGEVRKYSVSGASTYTWSNSVTTSSVVLGPSITTVYTVTGATSAGCQASKTMTITVKICTDILEHVNINTSIYPNPFGETLQIVSGEKVTVFIASQFGSVVWQQVLEPGEHTLDTSKFPAGFYVISLSANGSEKNLRFIKATN